MYKITFHSSVVEDLQNFPKEKSDEIIEKIENKLILDPFYYPELKGNYKGLRRMKVGLFRVIFTVHKDEITILRVGKRQ